MALVNKEKKLIETLCLLIESGNRFVEDYEKRGLTSGRKSMHKLKLRKAKELLEQWGHLPEDQEVDQEKTSS